MYFLFGFERERRLGAINALVYQSFNFGAKVLLPADRTKLSALLYPLYFFPLESRKALSNTKFLDTLTRPAVVARAYRAGGNP